MSRWRNVHQTIDIMEGEDENSDSDLEITKVTRKDLDLDGYIQEVAGDGSQSSHTEEGDSRGRKRRWTRMPAKGVQIQWSDDDDLLDATSSSKKGKSATARRAPAAKRQKTAKSTSVVGKRVRKRTAAPNGKAPKLKSYNTYLTVSESENELPDEVLPDYVKKRKTRFNQIHVKLGEAGLKLPPKYEDVEFSDDEHLAHLAERPVLSHLDTCAPYQDITLIYSAGLIPAAIAQWLRPYQVEGAAFLHEHFVFQRGGILGDDMGLGKTIQVIAFLTAAFGKTADERDRKRMRKMRRAPHEPFYPRVLIVCPGTLLDNWRAELERWGWWHIYVFHGNEDSKKAALEAAASGRLEIMITTYDTYKGSSSAINMIDWDCVIADECHIMKNRSSAVTRAMNEVNALCRIGLSGTAIQNNYDELWTLLNWTNPGRFGALTNWKQSISTPLKMGQAHDCTKAELATARKTAKKLVGHLLPRYFLRRMKSLIADQLPEKKDRIVFCDLTKVQAEAYMSFLDCDVVEAIRSSGDMCPCASGKKRGWCCYTELEDGTSWKTHVFPCVATLQKLANHVAMLIPRSDDGSEKQSKDLEKLQIALPKLWKGIYRQKDSVEHLTNRKFCGKLKALQQLLTFWWENPSETGPNKILIFSHSKRLLKMLDWLFKTTTDYTISYLDGDMKYEDRTKTVNEFNADPERFVFLISTKAGGVGLNIASANKVVVCDPNWNPSYDLQAQDRAYRIGQMRDVEVFRLVSVGTIEEIVYARQIYKQQQANIAYTASLERRYFSGVQDSKDKKGEIFGLQNLFAYQGDTVVLQEIVNKTNIAESRAGVLVAEFDSQNSDDDPEDEEHDVLRSKEDDDDAGMSQLAALITGDDDGNKFRSRSKAKSKTDAVQAILAGAGVNYTHDNAEVIGTSKIESKLSRQAIERGGDVDEIGQKVFSASQSQQEQVTQHFSSEDRDGLKGVKWKYRPPEDVRRRQFCSMAEHFGFKDVAEFALVVEGMTQAQRRTALDKFYRARREMLLPPDESKGGNDSDSSDEL